MSFTRKNPHDIKQTAKDLAAFIIYGHPQELIECIKEAKDLYQQPLNSWTMMGFVYWLLQTRVRAGEVDKVLGQISDDREEADNADSVMSLFEQGGWESTSFNTVLLKKLVSKLAGYPRDGIDLNQQEIIKLRAELVLKQMQLLQEKYIAEQQKLIELQQARYNEIETAIQAKSQALAEFESRLSELENEEELRRAELEEELAQHSQQLAVCQTEIKELQLKQDELKQQPGIKLNADAKELDSLTEEQRAEALKVAEAALRTYVKELAETDKKKAQLASMKGNLARAQDQLKKQATFVPKTQERQEELQRIAAERSQISKVGKMLFKRELAMALFARAPQVSEKEKELLRKGQVVSASEDLRKVVVDDNYREEPKKVVSDNEKPSVEDFAKAKSKISLMLHARKNPTVVKTTVDNNEKPSTSDFERAKCKIGLMLHARQNPVVKTEVTNEEKADQSEMQIAKVRLEAFFKSRQSRQDESSVLGQIQQNDDMSCDEALPRPASP